MYFPMTLLGYLALGDQLEADLINSLTPDSFYKSAAQVLFMLNLTTSMVSVISPVYQQLEDSIGIPTGEAQLEEAARGVVKGRVLSGAELSALHN